jgi:hypothetical protein
MSTNSITFPTPDDKELLEPLELDVLWARLTMRMRQSEVLVARFNELLCTWMVRTVGRDLKSLELQQELFTAASQRYSSVQINYDTSALIKVPVTNKETCFPTTRHLHMGWPNMVNTVIIKEMDRDRKELMVVCRWRPVCENRDAGEFQRDCKHIKRHLKEAPAFREWCHLPKMQDCKLEECLLHLVYN